MKYLNFLFAGLLLTNFSLMAAPEPYESIRNLPQTPYYVQDGWVLYDLIQSHNAGIVIDVESHEGSVARYIAQQAPQLPYLQKIYAVNSWKSYTPAQRFTFQRFLSNVKQENTTELIIPIRMASQEATWALNVTADFIFIVGSNDQDLIYKDIIAWFSHLSDGGVIAGNNWNENSVEIGVTKAANALDLPLHINGNVWYLEKLAQN